MRDRAVPQRLRLCAAARIALATVPVAAAAAVLSFLPAGCAAPAERSLRPASAFTLPKLTGGDSLSLSDLEGQYVLLNFWASWCAPCREEIPALLKLQRRFAGTGLTLVGVTVNDLPEDSRGFAREYGLDYLNVVGNEKLYEEYGLSPWIPVTMLISPDRRILREWIGPQTEVTFMEGIRQAAPELEAAVEPAASTLAPRVSGWHAAGIRQAAPESARQAAHPLFRRG